LFLILITIPVLTDAGDDKSQELQLNTSEYLKQIKEILEKNTLIPEFADQERKNWLTDGYYKAKKMIKDVSTEEDSYGVLVYYTNGFHDSHTAVEQNKGNKSRFTTPNFTPLKDNERYIVSNADKSLKNIKNGDEIILCDRMTLLEYYKKYLYPYVKSSPPPSSWDLTLIFVDKGVL